MNILSGILATPISAAILAEELIVEHGHVKAVMIAEAELDDYFLAEDEDLVEAQQKVVTECLRRLDLFLSDQKTRNESLEKFLQV